MKKLKVLFCAYNWVGVEIIKSALERDDISDIAVCTHIAPNNHVGNVCEICEKHGIWYSTENVNRIKLPFKPDIISSIYYRYIIGTEIINDCQKKIFNLHPSLLPLNRGCSSVPWAIINNEKITGITYHYIDEGIDTGKIILQAAIQISANETQTTLYQKCMEKGVQFWPAAFSLVKENFIGVEQDGEASYHQRNCPYEGMIDENWTLEKIERFIRAMDYQPYPYATYRGKEIKTIEDYLKLNPSK